MAHLLWKCILTGGDLQLDVPGDGILCANMKLTVLKELETSQGPAPRLGFSRCLWCQN